MDSRGLFPRRQTASATVRDPVTWLRIEGVRGSNPLISTRRKARLQIMEPGLFAVQSLIFYSVSFSARPFPAPLVAAFGRDVGDGVSGHRASPAIAVARGM